MATDTIEVNVRGYRMEVQFNYWKATNGARDSFNGRAGAGIQLEPDEPAGMEVEAIKLLDPGDIMEIITEEVTITIDDVMEAIEKYQDD